jgi:hypothetical protein
VSARGSLIGLFLPPPRPTGFFLLLSLLAIPAFSQPGREGVPTLVLRGGTLLDVHTGRQVADSVIVVVGDRIRQVGRAADIAVPGEARVVDVRGPR